GPYGEAGRSAPADAERGQCGTEAALCLAQRRAEAVGPGVDRPTPPRPALIGRPAAPSGAAGDPTSARSRLRLRERLAADFHGVDPIIVEADAAGDAPHFTQRHRVCPGDVLELLPPDRSRPVASGALVRATGRRIRILEEVHA